MIDNMLNFVMTPTGYATFTILAIKSTAIIVVGLLLWLALRGAAASARHMVLGATKSLNTFASRGTGLVHVPGDRG